MDHTTVFRWVQHSAPELDRWCRPAWRTTNDSYRVDETYIKIKNQWHDLYQAVGSTGATLDFMLSTTRDANAPERLFRKVLGAHHTAILRDITVGNFIGKCFAFLIGEHSLVRDKAQKYTKEAFNIRKFKIMNFVPFSRCPCECVEEITTLVSLSCFDKSRNNYL